MANLERAGKRKSWPAVVTTKRSKRRASDEDEDGKWECRKCTLKNSRRRKKCQVCQAYRVKAEEVPEEGREARRHRRALQAEAEATAQITADEDDVENDEPAGEAERVKTGPAATPLPEPDAASPQAKDETSEEPDAASEHAEHETAIEPDAASEHAKDEAARNTASPHAKEDGDSSASQTHAAEEAPRTVRPSRVPPTYNEDRPDAADAPRTARAPRTMSAPALSANSFYDSQASSEPEEANEGSFDARAPVAAVAAATVPGGPDECKALIVVATQRRVYVRRFGDSDDVCFARSAEMPDDVVALSAAVWTAAGGRRGVVVVATAARDVVALSLDGQHLGTAVVGRGRDDPGPALNARLAVVASRCDVLAAFDLGSTQPLLVRIKRLTAEPRRLDLPERVHLLDQRAAAPPHEDFTLALVHHALRPTLLVFGPRSTGSPVAVVPLETPFRGLPVLVQPPDGHNVWGRLAFAHQGALNLRPDVVDLVSENDIGFRVAYRRPADANGLAAAGIATCVSSLVCPLPNVRRRPCGRFVLVRDPKGLVAHDFHLAGSFLIDLQLPTANDVKSRFALCPVEDKLLAVLVDPASLDVVRFSLVAATSTTEDPSAYCC